MSKSVLVPLCNEYANGDFTATVSLVGVQSPLNLIIDTGSSGLAIKHCHVNKINVVATRLAQHLAYGEGSWTGPVVQTRLTIGDKRLPKYHCHIDKVFVAIAQNDNPHTFAQADGIIGLAYESLNVAHDLTALLDELGVSPNKTFPWPAALSKSSEASIKHRILSSPKRPLTPYFDLLENHDVVANQFAFVVHRSSIYRGANIQKQQEVSHPLNTGILILGEPKEYKHLHQDDFINVKVVHDKYYNIHIRSIYVEGQEAIAFPRMESIHIENYVSNGIVDSGASAIVFPRLVFSALRQQLIAHNSEFEACLAPFKCFTGKEVGIAIDQVKLEQWPNICIEVDSPSGSVSKLTLTPNTYWQTHSPCADQIAFKITTLNDWPNQGILGLPLLNNYFTIFNRSKGQNGQIEFANKTFSPHLLPDEQHRSLSLSQQHFKDKGHLT